MSATRTRIPDDLAAALESGSLTRSQLRQLVALEAEELGLSYEDAVERAHCNTLPATPLGSDIHFLIMLLDSEPELANPRGYTGPLLRGVRPHQP